MEANNSGNVAVFVDCTYDAISDREVEGLLHEASTLGPVTERRIYGYSSEPGFAWPGTDHSFIAIETHINKSGTDSSDFAMIMDIMDLLYLGDGTFSWFCIASTSDCSEFLRLVQRIQKANVRG